MSITVYTKPACVQCNATYRALDKAGVDYIFEVPLKVAQSIVGFKHDENCPHLSEGYFAVLSGSVPRNSFVAWLFGR